MQMSDILFKEAIAVESSAVNKGELLKELAAIACCSELLKGYTEEQLAAAFEEREKLGSTGFGGGIAIPHCRIEGLDRFVVGLLVHKNGVDFAALDKKPSTIFAFIVGPAEMKNEHVHVLSKISRVLSAKGVVAELLSASTADGAYETILRHSGDDLTQESTELEAMVQCSVVVQREDIFEPLVEIFTALEHCSAAVLRADDSSSYFGTVPLFKSFFADDSSFNRMIVATLPKKLANETVRQIESVTGDLKQKSGVLVTVQELFYCNGSLNY